MNTSVDFWKMEAGRQRNIINTYSNVPLDKIQVRTSLVRHYESQNLLLFRPFRDSELRIYKKVVMQLLPPYKVWA